MLPSSFFNVYRPEFTENVVCVILAKRSLSEHVASALEVSMLCLTFKSVYKIIGSGCLIP